MVSSPVTTHVPTHRGDVLILRTERSYTIHVVGRVLTDGQQDFHGQTNLSYVPDQAEAEAAAKRLVATSGGRIFVSNIDTAVWSEVTP